MSIGDVKIIQSSISLSAMPSTNLPTNTGDKASTNTSLIVMVVVIPLVIAALIVGVVIYCIRKRRNAKDNSEENYDQGEVKVDHSVGASGLKS